MDLREVREFIIDSAKMIAVIVAVICVIMYIATIQQIVGSSMSPTFNSQEIVILNRLHYRFFDIKRYDIVSFEYDSTKYLIKRVIGLPGETIEYKDNILYVNGKKVKEEFLAKDTTTENFSLKGLGYEKIPEGMYLVLGDNREDSLDSREIGLIEEKEILGKVNLRIWPIFKISYVK